MYLLASIALLATVSGWLLIGTTTTHLLSGHFDQRSCLTDCVQTYFHYAIAAGASGLLLSFMAVLRQQGRALSGLALLLALPLCGIFATLYLVGNYA